MRWLPVVVILALTAPAAASHKILVLPVDGTADAAARAKLTAEVVRLARALDGELATGSATFADTALAVGCDPQAQGCSDAVIATLGVDELVWGTATRDTGHIRLVVRRTAKGTPTREVSVMIAVGEPGDRAATAIAPLFAPPVTVPDPAAARASGSPPPPPPAPVPIAEVQPGGPAADSSQPSAAPGPAPGPGRGDDRRDRTVGIALISGGGLAVVLGLSLWASYSSLQGAIDQHPVRTFDEIQDLKSLEDRASARAISGDVFVIAGLVAGGVGAFYLYRDHRRHAIAIAPAPIAHGGGLTIALIGGL